MKADAWNGGLVLGDYDRSVPTFCFLQQNLYNGKLKISYTDGQPQSYKYRVWGTIYACSDCPTIAIGMSVLYIKIDKIEYQN